MKIFLIGLPGSGKSTLASELSAHLSVPFIDLDEAIEKEAGRMVKDIFKDQGESAFRELERTVLAEMIGHEGDFVMATGGGTPCFHDNIEAINNAGVSIFLDVPIHQIANRLAQMDTRLRPLLSTEPGTSMIDRLEQLRAQRLHFYQRATHCISADQISVNDLLGVLPKKADRP